MRYSVQPRDRIFIKCYGFLYLAKTISKNIGKNISKTQPVNIVKNLLIMLNKPQQITEKYFKKSNSKISRSN